jgi:hypothetical protein
MLFEGLLLIASLDIIGYLISSLINNKNPDHNTRWFFIHFIINGIVTYYNFEDLKYCLKNIESCTLEHASPNAYYATDLVMLAHLYHILVFYNHLKSQDWLHHLTMCGFNGPVFYYQHLKIQSVTAYFCSGLPGLIDYFLLYLVKNNLLNKKIEKDIYLFLTTYIRSPGCVLTTLLTIPYFLRPQIMFDYLISFISIMLVFWNGQYYMKKTCIDYGRKYN